jgi:hypothetical protein
MLAWNRRNPFSVQALLTEGGLSLLAACGGTEPRPPETPVPEKVYVASLTPVGNNCGVTDVESFELYLLPQQGGTSISGLFAQPISAEFSNDVLTFDHTAPVGDSLIMVFGGEWTFAEDRNTFQGTATLDLTFQQTIRCLYTYSTSGFAIGSISSETPPDPNEPTDASVSSLSSALDAAGYGAVYTPQEAGVTGFVESTSGVICDVANELLPRTVTTPQLRVTDLRNSMFGQVLAGRVMRTTAYLMRWSPAQQDWIVADVFQLPEVPVYPRPAVFSFGSPDPTPGDHIWVDQQGVLFQASEAGYYTAWVKHEWVVALGGFVVGTVWQYYPSFSDYFTRVAGSGVTAAPGWCHIP